VAQSRADIYLLAKLIHSEARGEPYIGQVAVGAVVLNRIKSPNFPDTLEAVIYQPFAFTAVDDGQINLEPNESAFKAAEDAFAGWDPSYGSLFYYNPTTATSAWIFTRETVTEIGKHIFAI
jgi:N-acetylmuramoyl-L-alanine amidase